MPDANIRGWGAGNGTSLYLPLTFSVNLKLLRRRKKKRGCSCFKNILRDLILNIHSVGSSEGGQVWPTDGLWWLRFEQH